MFCCSVQGLSNQEVAALQSLIQEQIEANLGMAMLYTLVSAAQEWMRDKVRGFCCKCHEHCLMLYTVVGAPKKQIGEQCEDGGLGVVSRVQQLSSAAQRLKPSSAQHIGCGATWEVAQRGKVHGAVWHLCSCSSSQMQRHAVCRSRYWINYTSHRSRCVCRHTYVCRALSRIDEQSAVL